MSFQNKTTLLFDLDGTLIDSAPDLALAGNLMLESLGREPFDESHFRQWIGNGARVMVQRALSGSSEVDENLDAQLVATATELFFEHYRQNVCIKTVLYEGVASTLEQLKARGFRMVVVTNKPIEFVEPINKALNIHHFFELNLGGDSLPTKKPDPALLFHVCEKLNVSVEQCLMIGDSKNDIMAAKNAKMDSIGLSYGYNHGEDIGIYQPDAVLDNFADILDWV